MEMEPNQAMVPKKVWDMVKIMLYMLRKGISKGKLLVDLHIMMLKRCKIASKALANLMLYQHYASSTCRSNEMSFVSPGEYEFSCSNTPLYSSHFAKRKYHHHHKNVAHKVAEILSNYEKAAASPLALPGFGPSPLVRKLRVTDSPFPLNDGEQDGQVDKAAEEFINKFYNDLKQQKRLAALASPSPYHLWSS